MGASRLWWKRFAPIPNVLAHTPSVAPRCACFPGFCAIIVQRRFYLTRLRDESATARFVLSFSARAMSDKSAVNCGRHAGRGITPQRWIHVDQPVNSAYCWMALSSAGRSFLPAPDAVLLPWSFSSHFPALHFQRPSLFQYPYAPMPRSISGHCILCVIMKPSADTDGRMT